jgi:hypothetical protein
VLEGQLFTIVAEHGVEVLLLFGEHANHTWPESRSYGASQHAERVLMYPETPQLPRSDSGQPMKT